MKTFLFLNFLLYIANYNQMQQILVRNRKKKYCIIRLNNLLSPTLLKEYMETFIFNFILKKFTEYFSYTKNNRFKLYKSSSINTKITLYIPNDNV